MAEAAVLVLLTSITVTVSKGDSKVEVYGRELAMTVVLTAVVALIIVRLALALTVVKLTAVLSKRVLITGRQCVAFSYLQAGWDVQHSEPAGRLQELMTTFMGQTNHILKAFIYWLSAWLSLGAFLFAALLVDPASTFFVFLALMLMGSVLYPIRAAIRKRGGRDATSGLNFTNAVAEFGSLGLEMHVYGVKNAFLKKINEVSQANAIARARVLMMTESLGPTYLALAYIGVVLGVAVMVGQGASDLGTTGAVLLLMLRSLSYGQSIQGNAGSVAAALPYVTQLEDAVTSYSQTAAPNGTSRPDTTTPIQFEKVSFHYPDGHHVLHRMSFKLQAHEVVGIIGPSGAGKSTLAQLMLGLRHPTEGRVSAAGIDLVDIDRSWWTERVAVVAQDAQLFTGTIGDNIEFFREGIDRQAIEEALEQANLGDVVARLPHGLDTHLGERGANLSGGQRQRLSIARALVGKPELLILDEPTSALDVHSEALIRDSINKIRSTTTVVIIAHRMSTLDICDRIMVVEGGQIAGLDTPEALHKDNEFYQNALAMSGITPKPSSD